MAPVRSGETALQRGRPVGDHQISLARSRGLRHISPASTCRALLIQSRRAEAEDHQAVESAERGASIFANNCRICHGNTGLGSAESPLLIGRPLNIPSNTFAYRSDNAGALQGLQNVIGNTIACGRNGTPMPPWAIDQGGSLNSFKIQNLVDLITTNAGNGWEFALEKAKEQDETVLASLKSAIRDADASGDASRIEEAQAALANAQSRYDQGLQWPSMNSAPPAVKVAPFTSTADGTWPWLLCTREAKTTPEWLWKGVALKRNVRMSVTG